MKRAYSGFVFAAMLCVLSFFFVSCAAPASSSSSIEPSSAGGSFSGTLDDAPAAVPEETPEPEAPSFTEDLQFHSMTASTANDSGFYEIALRADGSGNIFYTDLDALRKSVLCSRPGCSHQDEACSGYLPCAANIPEVMANSDLLILACPGNPFYAAELGNEAFARIEIRDLNGENARTVCAFDPNVQLDFNFAYSESTLFVLAATEGAGNSVDEKEVLRIDLDTGEKTVLARFDCRSGESYYFVGAANGKLFLKKSRVDEVLLNELSEEGISTANITKSLLFELFTIDPASGERTELRDWRSGETVQKLAGGACFFVNPGSIDRFDFDTGEMQRVVSDQEYCSPDTVEQVYFMDPYLIYNIHYPAEDPADAVIRRFICNVETLELRESTLTTRFQGRSDPIFIEAITPQYLLVGYSIEDVPPSEQDAYFSRFKRRYAVLDLGAFLQNRPDYTVIAGS